MNDSSPGIEYDELVGETLVYWQESVYDGVLVEHVLPAVRIYAYSSLVGVAEPSESTDCFPLMPKQWTLPEHYANSIFIRLSTACSSVLSALQAIHARIDGHSAMAISRRAHESLWQTFWLFNPDIDAGERMRRLLALTAVEIKETLRVFPSIANAEIHSRLTAHLDNIKGVTAGLKYQAKWGRDEYSEHVESRAVDSLGRRMQDLPGDVDAPSVAWSMMSNMTHPNMVFDLLTQTQAGYQDLMDRLQIDAVCNAMGCACNISTMLMESAQIPDDKTHFANGAFRQPILALDQLSNLRRERNRPVTR